MVRKTRLYVGAAAVVGSGLGYAQHVFRSSDSRYSDFPDFAKHHNLMSTILTKAMYINYKNVFTPSGFTIDKCIQVGVDNVGGTVMGRRDPGIVAGDAECYETFPDLFDGIIKGYHASVKAPMRDLTELPDALGPHARLDPRHVIALKVRCYRNLDVAPFGPAITRGGRRHVEAEVQQALDTFQGELKGAYHPIKTMSEKVMRSLASLEIPFTKPATDDARVAGITRDWPVGRGMFVNAANTLAVMVNGTHHIELTSVEHSSDLAKVVARAVSADTHLEDSLRRLGCKYQWQHRLGFTGPTVPDLGNALELEAVVHLPRASTDVTFLKRLKELQLKPIAHEDEDRGIWRLVYRPSFDSDVQHVKKFASAINSLIAVERAAAV